MNAPDDIDTALRRDPIAADGPAAWGTSNPTTVALEELTWSQLVDTPPPVLLVPVGSTEQHGPHLPIGTDSLIANRLATHAASHAACRCVVAPPLPFSASGEHADFPGTLSIGTTVTTDALVELARSADWAAAVVFVNGHGGNAEAITRAQTDWDLDRPERISSWSPRPPDDRRADWHAGWVETSVMLWLAPTRVHTEHIVAGTNTPDVSILRSRGVRAVDDSGILGDPTSASADDGRTIFESWTVDLIAHIDHLTAGEPYRSRPL